MTSLFLTKQLWQTEKKLLMSHYVLLWTRITQKHCLFRLHEEKITGLQSFLTEGLQMNFQNGLRYEQLIRIIRACLKLISRKLEKVCPKPNFVRNTKQISIPTKDKFGTLITKNALKIWKNSTPRKWIYFQALMWGIAIPPLFAS